MDDSAEVEETPEVYAARLLSEGYNSALVAGRLVDERGLRQSEADRVVVEAGKGRVDLVGQRRLQLVLVGSLAVATGIGLVAYGLFLSRNPIRMLLGLGVGAASLAVGVKRLISAASKNPEAS